MFLRGVKLARNFRNPFIRTPPTGEAILVHQDGPQKHGNPRPISLKEASRTALSTIATAEFPHLNALRQTLAGIRFLEINPQSARSANDRFADPVLRPDASNLAAALARLKASTADKNRPDGVLADIAADLASLIPSVRGIESRDDPGQRGSIRSVSSSTTVWFSAPA